MDNLQALVKNGRPRQPVLPLGRTTNTRFLCPNLSVFNLASGFTQTTKHRRIPALPVARISPMHPVRSWLRSVVMFYVYHVPKRLLSRQITPRNLQLRLLLLAMYAVSYLTRRWYQISLGRPKKDSRLV